MLMHRHRLRRALHPSAPHQTLELHLILFKFNEMGINKVIYIRIRCSYYKLLSEYNRIIRSVSVSRSTAVDDSTKAVEPQCCVSRCVH